jgi:hypothetical protein
MSRGVMNGASTKEIKERMEKRIDERPDAWNRIQ